MRILFISAFYPPHVIGGWEQLVRDINLRLQQRGHDTHVLTSTHGVNEAVLEPGVSRLLLPDCDLHHYRLWDFLDHKRRVNVNLRHTRQVITDFQPDVVFVHVMFNLTQAIPWQAEQLLPGRVVYYVANNWPHAPSPHAVFWRDGARNPLVRAGKRALAPWPLAMVNGEKNDFRLQFSHVQCVSEAVRQDLLEHAGIPPTSLQVVHNGVETDLFAPDLDERKTPADSLRLLYAGSLVTHKGVHTAVAAMAHLKEQQQSGISLDILGSGHPDYEALLRSQVAEAGLQTAVRFLGRVPRAEMPRLLRNYDVLLFPSIWAEPLSRMMQEGMAAGLVVVGTLTGGSGELLVEGETGLTFPPDDAIVLAERVLELRDDPALQQRLARKGREAVVNRFGMDRMIDEIEGSLQAVVARRATADKAGR